MPHIETRPKQSARSSRMYRLVFAVVGIFRRFLMFVLHRISAAQYDIQNNHTWYERIPVVVDFRDRLSTNFFPFLPAHSPDASFVQHFVHILYADAVQFFEGIYLHNSYLRVRVYVAQKIFNLQPSSPLPASSHTTQSCLRFLSCLLYAHTDIRT